MAIEIQSKSVFHTTEREDEKGWKTWRESDNPEELLKALIEGINEEAIDDANRWWRVKQVN